MGQVFLIWIMYNPGNMLYVALCSWHYHIRLSKGFWLGWAFHLLEGMGWI